MTALLIGTGIWAVLTYVLLNRIGFAEIKAKWQPFTLLKTASWIVKMALIVTGLILGIKVVWLITLMLVLALLSLYKTEEVRSTRLLFHVFWLWATLVLLAQNYLG